MDELRYMKQLVREYFDVLDGLTSDDVLEKDIPTLGLRLPEIARELKILSGFNRDDVREPLVLDDY